MFLVGWSHSSFILGWRASRSAWPWTLYFIFRGGLAGVEMFGSFGVWKDCDRHPSIRICQTTTTTVSNNPPCFVVLEDYLLQRVRNEYYT